MRLTSVVLFMSAGVHFASAAEVAAGSAAANDYPTSARADYVFACMKTNGDTREALDQCSCSIDVIASLIPVRRLCDSSNGRVDEPSGRTDRLHVPRNRNRARRAGPAAARSGGKRNTLFLTAPVR